MTSLVHVGDVHAAPDARNPERFKILDLIIGVGCALQNLGAWLIPGDLNGPLGRPLTVDNRNAWADRLQRMAAQAPILIVPGNHDQKDDLDIFAKVKAEYQIYVVTQPGTRRIRLATGEMATVFCFPYPTKESLVAIGIVPAEIVAVESQILDLLFQQAGRELAEARQAGDLTFMIGHVNVSGAIRSNAQPSIGQELEITERHLEYLGPCYKGLNHIHKPQQIGGARYAGSIFRQNFGEIEEKMFLSINLLENGDWLVNEHPLPIPPMFHVEASLSRDGLVWKVTDGPGGSVLAPPDGWHGSEVRVRYTIQQSEVDVLGDHRARVAAEFPDTLRLVLEPSVVPDRGLRAPAVAQAKTLTAKVQAWADVSQAATPDSVLQKLQQLERSDPATLLSAIAEELRIVELEDEVVEVS